MLLNANVVTNFFKDKKRGVPCTSFIFIFLVYISNKLVFLYEEAGGLLKSIKGCSRLIVRFEWHLAKKENYCIKIGVENGWNMCYTNKNDLVYK